MAKDKLFVRISNTDTAPMLILNLDALSSKVAEVEEMSITPRTFISRTFNAGILNQDPNKQTDLDDYWFIDEYQYQQGAPVMRFGIDRGNMQLRGDELLGERVKVFSLSAKQSGGSGSTNKYQPIVTHHPLEILLAQKAVAYLNVCQENTVLLHVFERDGASLKFELDGHPKTHTVLLYKNPPSSTNTSGSKQQMFVIDPNNFTYSSHLRELNSHLDQTVELVTLHSKKLQIYKPVDVGPSKFRDCADICVKLGFLLNKYKPHLKTNVDGGTTIIDEDFLKNLDIIKMVSNVPSIDDGILVEKNIPARMKQASDITVVEKFYKFQGFINQAMKALSAYIDPAKVAVKQKELESAVGNINYDIDGTPDYAGGLKNLGIFEEVIYIDCKTLVDKNHQQTLDLLGN